MDPDSQPRDNCMDDCLLEVEEALKISIPISLKNVLKINACNNAVIFRDISDKDLEEMEKFMASEIARDLIPKNEYEDFYGIFHMNPEKFKFVLGHKKQLLLISKFFKDKFQEREHSDKGASEPSGQSIGRRSDYRSPGHSISSKSSDSNLSLNQAPNLTKEGKQVSETVRNWIKSKCTNDEQWQYFKEQFSQISFETKLNIRGELACTMTCFCKSKHQILKSAQKASYSRRWVYGNIHRHLTKHLNLYQQSKNVSEASERRIQGKDTKQYVLDTESSVGLSAESSAESKGALKKKPGIMKFFRVLASNSNTSTGTQPSTQSIHDVTYSRDYSEQDTKYISENKIQVHPAIPNEIEVQCEVTGEVQNINLSLKDKSDKPEDTPAAQSAGTSKINILSNQIIVQAMVHSRTQEESSHTISDDNNDRDNTDQHLQKELTSESSSELTYNDTSKRKSKWASEKYQRNKRARRKRENIDENKAISQTLISSFFPFLSKVEKEVENIIHNDETDLVLSTLGSTKFGTKFNETLKSVPQIYGEPSTHKSQLLKMLIDISIQNSDSSSSRYQYNDIVKKNSLYLFYIGGRLLYETIYENMKGVLPSITTLNKYVAEIDEKTEEGVFDYNGLSTFLKKRNLPKVVWISEDGTRVTGKIKYDSKNNKLVGFTLPLADGLPQTDTFLATSANAIQDFFLNSTRSNYAYAVMVQPLSRYAPPYCLALFGTDNRFDSNDVSKRWKHIKENLEMRGITVLGFSSDGDTRLLKAMRQHASLPPSVLTQTNNETFAYKWYQAGYKRNNFSNISYVQDTVHIATKLRTRFLNPKATLTMGSYTAKPAHLEQLITNFSKDKHLLISSDLKGEDKMCFKSAEKMCSEAVIQLLDGIAGSESTRAYLKVMQFAVSSYLDPALDVEDRIYKIWFSVFFLRIWRKWLTDQPFFKITDNFVTSNCYLCIELNAHSLINICTNFRENPNLKNDMFLPDLFSSQTCEKTFRATRSMTTTYSTVVNFSIKDIIRRLDRIGAINNVINDLQGVLSFPREEKKTMIAQNAIPDLKKLSDNCIQATVEKALQSALQLTKSLGMEVPEDSWNYIAIVLQTPDLFPPMVEDENEKDIDHEIAIIEDNNNFEILNTLSPSDHDITDPLADSITSQKSEMYTDMCNLSTTGIGKDLLLRDFSVKLLPEERNTIFEKGPLVRVILENGKSTIIKKSSLCWLLEQATQRVSSDRLRRFFMKGSNTITKSSIHGSTKPKTKVLAKVKKIVKKRACSSIRKSNIDPTSASDTESSDNQESVKYDDSTDTESFTDETEDQRNPVEYHSSNLSTTNMTSSNATETATSSFSLLQPECGKFYAIYYEQRWYLGLIINIDNDEYLVKFLRKKRSSEKEFLWPKPNDITKVSGEFIFYGPIEAATKSKETPVQLSDLQLKEINDKYKIVKHN